MQIMEGFSREAIRVCMHMEKHYAKHTVGHQVSEYFGPVSPTSQFFLTPVFLSILVRGDICVMVLARSS